MIEKAECGIKFSASLLHPRYWLTWIGLLFISFVAQLPNSARHLIGKWIGNSIYKNNKRRSDIVRSNLKICFPDMKKQAREEMTQKHLQWHGCALVDYSLLFFGSKRRLASMLEIEGKKYIDNAVNKNQSIVILLAHSVMLEFAPAALGLQYECFGSYKTSKNAVLDWMITRSRCRHVSFVVSREEGMRKLIKALIPKRLMIFLPDEDLGVENGVFAPFFEKSKATLTTTARLVKMGKAIALPAYVHYDPETQKYRTQILPPIQNYPTGDAVKDATLLNQSLEQLIKEHPAQYMWTMKWFKTRPENQVTLY